MKTLTKDPPPRIGWRRLMAWGGLGVVVAAMAVFLLRHPRPPEPGTETPWREVPRTALEQREGRWYERESTNAFTGWLVEGDAEGRRLARTSISNGIPNGVSEGWYPNGQLQIREHFVNGVSHGLRERWHANGQRQSEATIESGQVVGTFLRWHENGQLAERIGMKAGQADGPALAFYPSGCVKAETLAEAGRILRQSTWPDGERRAVP